MSYSWTQGALPLDGERCRFRVWAPDAEKVEVHQFAPQNRYLLLDKQAYGYHTGTFDGIPVGSRYTYRLDGKNEHPDPASRSQPDGVHKPSCVIDRAFAWDDACWFGVPLSQYVIYELHVGTFTPEGTFDAVIPRLSALKELGITAIELMPVAQFPGDRNWGYDGVYMYAAQNTYGGPDGLKRLVNAAHKCGLGVVLDVVYNHLGPEGNYLSCFGPYFTDAYKTPWGLALNYDGPWSDEVRKYFIGNALGWFEDFHIDALRLDATHSIVDISALPFLRELSEETLHLSDQLNRRLYLIAENDRNDVAFVQPVDSGGLGLDAQWNDDFHHCVHTLLTGEKSGYLKDFGKIRQLVRVLEEGYAYSGNYSNYRGRRHGNSSRAVPGSRFVVCSQNHDQIGNRMLGERLAQLVDFESLKLAAAATILSPYIPLLFMGEEYGETNPFLYFVSHGDEQLVEAVRKGRREEFAEFHALGEAPDPQSEDTFARSRIQWEHRDARQSLLREFYREVLRIRRSFPAFAWLRKDRIEVYGYEKKRVILSIRCRQNEVAALVMSFADEPVVIALPMLSGKWRKLLDSSDGVWGGPGSHLPYELAATTEIELHLQPHSAAAFILEDSET